MPQIPGSEFIVKLNGIKLPTAAEAKINAAIQQTVALELAKLDLKDDVAYHFPKEWYGIWLERLANRIADPINRIKEAQKVLRP
jgi:hypothetical protein